MNLEDIYNLKKNLKEINDNIYNEDDGFLKITKNQENLFVIFYKNEMD